MNNYLVSLQTAAMGSAHYKVLQTVLNRELTASLACCVGASAAITVSHIMLRSYPPA